MAGEVGETAEREIAPETKLRCVGSKGEGRGGGALIRQTEEEELEAWGGCEMQVLESE